MSRFRCLVQAGSNADTRTAELESRLRAHHTDHYPSDDVAFTWIPVPPGRMFTEGRPSTSSIVSCFVDHQTTLDVRASYMRGVCDLWADSTGCTDHEIVVTITDTVTGEQE